MQFAVKFHFTHDFLHGADKFLHLRIIVTESSIKGEQSVVTIRTSSFNSGKI